MPGFELEAPASASGTSGAPADAQYVVLAADTTLTNEALLSDLSGAAAATDVIGVKVTGDAAKRTVINGDGSIDFGSGSGAADTTIRRPAANTFDIVSTGTNEGLRVSGLNTTTVKLTAGNHGTAYKNLTLDASTTRIECSGTARIITDGTGIGFFGTTPVARPTGVAVTAAGVHAALVSLGLITA